MAKNQKSAGRKAAKGRMANRDWRGVLRVRVVRAVRAVKIVR
jgi:hypothetical protein